MSSTPAPIPDPIPEVKIPGRFLARTGFSERITSKKVTLRLGEFSYTKDDKRCWVGDEGQNPPWWPTSKYVGDLDWTGYNPTFNNINVKTINGIDITSYLNSGDGAGGGNTIPGGTSLLIVINENLIKKVYGSGADFADLDAAYSWLSQRVISRLGSVTLVFPTGKFIENKIFFLNHPNGDRIFWTGADLQRPMPGKGDYALTGNGSAAQAADKINNLALLRSVFSTEIAFTNGGFLQIDGNIGNMKNLLFTSDGANAPGAPYTLGVQFNNTRGFLENIAAVGFDLFGVSINEGSAMNLRQNSSLVALGNGSGGVNVSGSLSIAHATVVTIGNGAKYGTARNDGGITVRTGRVLAIPVTSIPTEVLTAGNTQNGLYSDRGDVGGRMNFLSRLNGSTGVHSNGTGGVVNIEGLVSRDNAGFGFYAVGLGNHFIPNSQILNNGLAGINAADGALVYQGGTNSAGNPVNYSPAPGVVGNNQALIY